MYRVTSRWGLYVLNKKEILSLSSEGKLTCPTTRHGSLQLVKSPKLKEELERENLEKVGHNTAAQLPGIAKELVLSGASSTFRNVGTSVYVMEESTFE
jgi:hypothetical protein